MFVPGVIGYGHVKTGLLISAASCSINDFRSHRTFRHRVRIHSFLIGDPGLAKSILLREIVRIVSNSRFESLQNTTVMMVLTLTMIALLKSSQAVL
jgi:DNA replicative helicase MCM subunit Mcm2 (Cdc46/Mcm family)